MSKEGTLHLTYWREYYDSEESGYDAWFKIYYTIFRNVPIKFLNKLNNDTFKKKVKAFCDKNFKEQATNDTGYTEVEILTGDEYYKTYADEFGADIVDNDNSYFNDYGQLWNTRQFFKYDFAPELTKSLDVRTYKNELKREGGNTYGKSRN